MKKLCKIAFGILCLCALFTSHAQFRNRNDLKFLNAATGKDSNTVYTTAVDNADLSLGGIYLDGMTVTGATTRAYGTLSAAVKVQHRANPNVPYVDIPSATASLGNQPSQGFEIKLPAGYYFDLRTVITGMTGMSTTYVYGVPWTIRR